MADQGHFDPVVINSGELRHAIDIQQKTNAPDPQTGEPSRAWVTVLSTSAGIRSATSREVYQAQQFSANVSHVVTIRWPGTSPAISGGMQVVYGTRKFTLQYADNVQERNRKMLLYCMEINGVANA